MLEGLGATEVLLSELARENEVLRIDAEYFDKNVLEMIGRLQAINATPLASLASVTDGIHTSLPFVEDGEVKVLSAKHPKDNFLDTSQFETISAMYHKANPRTALRDKDLLLSTVGTIGNAAVVTPEILPANSDRHIGIIRINQEKPSPFFVSTFLVSRYGRVQSIRETTGNVQPNLFISKIGKLLIPQFSEDFEERVTNTVRLAYKRRKQAQCHLVEAESTLYSALGLDLDIWQPAEALTYVRSSRDAFAAGRLDAEYFHPAKTQSIIELAALSNCKIGDLFGSIRDLWKPNEELKTNLVRNYDLTDALNPFLDSSKAPVERGAIESIKKMIKPGDLLVSRLRSYLKEIALLRPARDGIPIVASSEFIVLRAKQGCILPAEALLIFLRSALPQIILKWSQDGSNHPRFSEKELLGLPVPQILIDNAEEYVKLVTKMIEERETAAHLLDTAKRAVEIAIEKDEENALVYLRQTSEVRN